MRRRVERASSDAEAIHPSTAGAFLAMGIRACSRLFRSIGTCISPQRERFLSAIWIGHDPAPAFVYLSPLDETYV